MKQKLSYIVLAATIFSLTALGVLGLIVTGITVVGGIVLSVPLDLALGLVMLLNIRDETPRLFPKSFSWAWGLLVLGYIILHLVFSQNRNAPVILIFAPILVMLIYILYILVYSMYLKIKSMSFRTQT